LCTHRCEGVRISPLYNKEQQTNEQTQNKDYVQFSWGAVSPIEVQQSFSIIRTSMELHVLLNLNGKWMLGIINKAFWLTGKV